MTASLLRRALERGLDLVDDPILVKELRGTFRRWRWLALFTGALLLLGALVLAAILQADEAGDLDPSRVGRETFLLILGLLTLLSAVLFPAATCTAVIEERTAGSFDLLVTTRLGAWQIVRGKLLAACVHGLMLVASSAPLVAVTFLYGGVAPGQIGLAYAALLVAGPVVATYGLLVSSLSVGVARAVVRAFLGLPFVAFLALGPLVGLVWAHVVDPLVRGRPAAWSGGAALDAAAALGAAFLWALAWGALFLILTVNRLQPERADRHTPLRLWFLTVWGLALGLGTALRLAHEPLPGVGATFVLAQALGFTAVFFTLGAVALITEDDRPARGRDAPTRGPRALLLPGAGRGAAFLLTLAAATLVVLWATNEAAARTVGGGSQLRPLAEVRAWGTAWTAAFLLTVTQGALLLSRVARPKVARGVLVAALLPTAVVPALVYAAQSSRSAARLHHGYPLSPITALTSIVAAERGPFDRQLILFGPSGEALQESFTRWESGLHREVPGDPADPAVAGARAERREERLRALAGQGLRVRAVSTGLFAALGVALLGVNAALALRRR